ncbi:MAG: tyrosine-protein phosphatase [Deferribacterales bacterium]
MKFILKLSAAILILVFVLVLAATAYIRLGGNLHAVVEGELYRSGQPTPERIEAYHKKYGIKTIINLRGPSIYKKWYQDEIKTSTRLGIMHYDVPFSPTVASPLENMDHFLWLMKTAEKPVLVHCKGGSDRAGLASAIYLYGAKNYAPEDAKKAGFRAIYGHVPYLWSDTSAVQRSFDRFASCIKKYRGLK